MDALLETLLSIAFALFLFAAGLVVSVYGKYQKALADGAGWRQSYEHERETTERYRKAEDLAQAATVATKAALEAIGKLPPGAPS